MTFIECGIYVAIAGIAGILHINILTRISGKLALYLVTKNKMRDPGSGA